MDPTLDGQYVLGTACHVVPIPAPRATQRDTYCGQNGYTILDGGARGGHFRITGVLVAAADDFGGTSNLIAVENALKSFADGNLHVLIDTQDRTWPNVYFTGEYTPSPEGPKAVAGGWCLPYSLVMEQVQ